MNQFIGPTLRRLVVRLTSTHPFPPARPGQPLLAGLVGALSVWALTLGTPNPASAAEAVPFTGAKTSWHGFDRYDFVMDVATLAITPFQSPAGEGDGVNAPAPGQRRCLIVVPREAAPGNPWSWRGCYWNHMPQTEIALLNHGFCIAYISADATLKPGREWDAWYAFLTGQHGLSAKPAFIGMSRGGEYAYMWATTHPDEVSCLYADNPGGNPDNLKLLGALAGQDVPLLHVCGSLDPLLGKYSNAIENIYQSYGGRISVMLKEGYAHHPHSLPDPQPIVDFILHSVAETPAAPPAFVPGKFLKTAYYSTENSYRKFPTEGAYITCRGPQFVPCYDRYQFNTGTFGGAGVNVIVPPNPAPGNPWVFRAEVVGRAAIVDQALLARGFYIVTGPVPYDDGPVPAQWDATYSYLVDHGFSKKPVLEGAGAAAGEAWAWAEANPGQIACLYGENPILHSNLAKTQPLDNLAPLAQAGVPCLSVCGSLDPGLADNTKILETQYRKLGGPITVIIKPGAGHYPLTPPDPQPVVDFIVANATR